MLAGCTFLRLSRPCSHSAAADVTAGKIYVPMKGEKLHKTMIGAILLQILLIFGNAVFASAEIAVISMNDAKLKRMTHVGDKRAKKLTALTEQPGPVPGHDPGGHHPGGTHGGAFAAENFAGPLVGLLMSLGVPVPENVLHSVSVVLITLALTYFSLVFGELVPKRIAMKKPDSMALGHVRHAVRRLEALQAGGVALNLFHQPDLKAPGRRSGGRGRGGDRGGDPHDVSRGPGAGDHPAGGKPDDPERVRV